MFFDLILLNCQHEFGFGFAWLAGTQGIRAIKKNEIFKIDVAKLCENVMKYITSESDSPRSRFSLRLSTILVNGTLKIHRQQAIYLLEDLMKILSTVTAPVKLRVHVKEPGTTLLLTPPSPVQKVRGKKRHRPVEKETPESEIEDIIQEITRKKMPVEVPPQVEAPVPQARIEEISLREELPRVQEEMGFGEFGVITEDDLAQLQELRIQPVPQLPEERPQGIERLPVEKVPVSPPKRPAGIRVTVEAQVHAPASPEPPREVPKGRQSRRTPLLRTPESPDIITVVPEEKRPVPPPEIEEARPVPPQEEPMEVREAPSRAVFREIQVETIQERVEKMPPHKPRKKEDELAKLRINFQTAKKVRINRCQLTDSELMPLDQCPLPKMRLVEPNLTNLLNMYMIRGPLRDIGRERLETSSLRDSGALRRKSGRLTPVELSEKESRTISRTIQALPETLPLMTTTPIPDVSSTPLAERTTEETIAVAAEEPVVAPRKKRRLLDVESEVRLELEELEPVHVPVITQESRQQEIVNKLLNSETGLLTLEEACPLPINKLNIARTFNDLLILCRYNYVTLISEDNSSEMKFIEKGPKLLKK